MSNNSAKVARLLTIAAIVFMACARAEAAPPSAATGGQLLGQVGIAPQLGEQLPLDLEFTDSNGKTVTLSELFKSGRPVILHLVYYECPMLCRLSSDGLFNTLENLSLKLGDDFSIVTLSFDPSEGPELSANAKKLAGDRLGKDAVERGWHFLTGSESAIDQLTKTVGFRYAFDETSKEYAHAAGLFIITPDGKISRYLSGIQYLPRDTRLSLVEAAGNKIGTPTDQMMLLCYMYDPSTGKYGFAIMTILRTAGVLTVGCIAAVVITLLRRERKQEPLQSIVQKVLDNSHIPNDETSSGPKA